MIDMTSLNKTTEKKICADFIFYQNCHILTLLLIFKLIPLLLMFKIIIFETRGARLSFTKVCNFLMPGLSPGGCEARGWWRETEPWDSEGPASVLARGRWSGCTGSWWSLTIAPWPRHDPWSSQSPDSDHSLEVWCSIDQVLIGVPHVRWYKDCLTLTNDRLQLSNKWRWFIFESDSNTTSCKNAQGLVLKPKMLFGCFFSPRNRCPISYVTLLCRKNVSNIQIITFVTLAEGEQ